MNATKLERPQTFKYERPEGVETGKIDRFLGASDLIRIDVQLVTNVDGATNLHAHTADDEVWFVLTGRARWYTTNDVVIADQGKHEGIIIPRGFPYWFESVGDEPLQIIRVGARDKEIQDERIDYTPPKPRRVMGQRSS